MEEIADSEGAYFRNVDEGDAVFGLVFGPGKVTSVWENSHYVFEVTFENGQSVPYTIEGIPGWNSEVDFQTVYYKDDIDMYYLDFKPVEEILTPKKIIKLRSKKKLMVRCPSGVWQTTDHCPGPIVERYLENQLFHLFKKQRNHNE